MSHETYDRLADWLQARSWTQAVAIWGGSFAGCYGVSFGLVADLRFLLLLLLVPPAWLVMRIRWHGFLRHLDRKYPLVADLECSFDSQAWNAALARAERQ